jgi:hypothetical protein
MEEFLNVKEPEPRTKGSRVVTYLTPRLHLALKKRAKDRGFTMSAYIEQLLAIALGERGDKE